MMRNAGTLCRFRMGGWVISSVAESVSAGNDTGSNSGWEVGEGQMKA